MTSDTTALRAASTSIAGAGACVLISRVVAPERACAAGQQSDEVQLAYLAVTHRGIGLRGMIVREDDGAPRMGPETVQHRREVGIARTE